MVEAEGEEEGEEAVGVGGGRKIEKARASERGGGGEQAKPREGERSGEPARRNWLSSVRGLSFGTPIPPVSAVDENITA